VPLEGDSQSPSALLLRLNVFTALSLFRVRGTCPDFWIPPNTNFVQSVQGHTQIRGKDRDDS
jgi:hypothetical protein